MKNILKQLGELVTNYRNNHFFKARLKLTAYYTIGIFFIIMAYSVFTYLIFSQRVNDNYNDDVVVENQDEHIDIKKELLEEVTEHLKIILIILDGVSVFMAFGLSYYLAGKTLEPIKKSYLKQKKNMEDAAHELRTPLTVIKTGIQAVGFECTDINKYIKLNSEMLVELDRMIKIVNELLFLEKLDSLSPVNFDKIDFSKLVLEQVKFINPYALSYGIIFLIEAQSGIIINGNEIYLIRMLNNLFKNAIDYNKPGGRVDVKLKKENSSACLIIKDTGIGIPEKDINFIFERFYRVNRDISDYQKGVGLGLSIVKEIVEKHKGSIYIESKVDIGTTITLLFPMA